MKTAEPGEHSRDHHQKQRDNAGHHGDEALHIRIVAVSDLELEIAGIGCPIKLTRLASQPVGMHSLDIPTDGLSAARHGSVDPGSDLDTPPTGDVTAKAGRNFDYQAELARSHASVQVVVVDNRRLLVKVPGSGNLLDVVLADRSVVAVKHGKREVLNVHVDAVADDEH
jgi:hypothetical protein